MATSKPRVTVTLEPDDYALLRELAELSDESMSSILADLLATTAPPATACGGSWSPLQGRTSLCARRNPREALGG